MTELEFAKGMAFLGACLDRDISHATVEAWFLLLGDMDVRQFERAVVDVIRHHKFSGLPPVGLIRQAAGVSGGVVDADSGAILAWDRVLKAIREIGAYKSVEWDDPAIPAAIETIAGTWPLLCDKPTDELHTWTKKSFLEAYKAHRTARTQASPVTPGLIAEDAGRLGYEPPEAVAVGDEPKRLYGFNRAQPLPALPGPAETVAKVFGHLPGPVEDLILDDEAEEVRRRSMKAMQAKIERETTEA